ncbi:transcriptional repressor LexA [Candidatus Berkelbacteria bacterium]|nr:transcriptional repressor LexA [Candidatus Berkelbacteria bacterium]
MKLATLTPKQKGILDYLRGYIEDHGYAPSYREIAEHFHLRSVATVAEHIDTLQAKGHLDKDGREARSLQLTPTWDERAYDIPLLGSIAAGSPIAALRTNETIDIPRSMMAPDVFALKVSGDSMQDDGILDGDYVVIQRTDRPRNGDIVVALLDEESVTLKRFYKERGRIRLQPANPKYKPIYTNHVNIQGRVLGVIRQLSLAQ